MMVFLKSLFLIFIILKITIFVFIPSKVFAVSISNVNITKDSVRVYEKQEITFQVDTASKYPFFEYDLNPPPGVTPGIGISVEGEFTNLDTGKKWKHPGFYMTKVIRSGAGPNAKYIETSEKFWVIRFSPQEVGTYEVKIKATDSSGTTIRNVGTFKAITPVKKGFIRISRNDSRYFEFSNGQIYWPIGPAWLERENWDYSLYKDTGINLERPWMAGKGIYNSTWARWWSSAEKHGNEGVQTRLTFKNKAPGSDLSYELFYPEGFRFWLSEYHDKNFYTPLKPNTKYKIFLRYKTIGITGPRQSTSEDYGLTVKIHKTYFSTGNEPPFENKPPSMIEPLLANAPRLFPHIKQNTDWTTLEITYTTPSFLEGTDLSIMLDNVTAGRAYIDEFSIRECMDVNCNNLGGEIIRNPKADIHTYIEQRPAAFFDYQVEQAEKNDVYLKFVVHDKNDWIQKHLLKNGQWADNGDGYYQPENTKARWLLRQYYRYLVARWGYSTAVFGWELNNEGPPNEDPPGSQTSPHWETAQAFAQYIKSIDAHPHTASTSFWCCWRPVFWGGDKFKSIDYADIHDYLTNDGRSAITEYLGIYPNPYDIADWRYQTALMVLNSNIGKPTLVGETGIDFKYSELARPNSGLWYHDMLWVQLAEAVIYDFNYWFPEHIEQFDRRSIAKPFWNFLRDVDFHKGGYIAAKAVASDSNVKVYGQKNLQKNKAILWIKNKNHNWQTDITNPNGNYSLTGTVTLKMNPSTLYPVSWYNTFTGQIIAVQTLESNSSGDLVLQLNNMSKSVAVKIGDFSSFEPTNTPGIPMPTLTPSITIATVFPSPSATPTITMGNGDVNNDQQVNSNDVRIILSNFFSHIFNAIDQYMDGFINSFDFAVVAFRIKNNTLTSTITPSPTPTLKPPTLTPTVSPSAPPTPTLTLTPTQSSPPALSNEWTQHGQNAQRTSYAPVAVPTPWKWKWTWNGPDNPYAYPSSGKQSYNNKIIIPKNVQPVVGGGRVYIAAGSNGVYGLSFSNGSQLWNSRPGGSINSTAAYDKETDSVFVVSSNGNLYKLNASTGAVIATFSSGSSSQLWLPPAIVGSKVFFSMGMNVYAIDKNTMSRIWSYNAGSLVQTPPSYSATRDIIIVVSKDLYVHAIKNSDGSRFWRVKPTHNSLVPGDPKSSPSNNFANPSYGWPVIADRTGIVLIRYELDWQTLWTTTWPTTNEEMRRFLLNNPDEQSLYALNLDDGSTAFIPNVGNGGFGDGGILPMGPLPAIRTLPDNKEVAYIIIRGELSTISDGRGDSKFGELIIDPSTAPGYEAGYVRFIEYNRYSSWDRYGKKEWKENTAEMPTDEQPYVTVAGNQILAGHWMVGKALMIVDRSPNYGSYNNPILSMPLPHIVVSTTSNFTDGCSFSTSYYCSSTIIVQENGRPFAGPGFYIHYGNYGNRGEGTGDALYDIFWSEYASWIVSENTVIFRSTDGALFALVNGNPVSENRQSVLNNVAGVTEKDHFSDDRKPFLYRINPSDAHKYIGKEVIIEGTISSTFDNGKAFYIDLGTKNQNGFVIKILNSKKKNFATNFKDKFVVGKKITVIGQVGMYQKNPVLYINNQNQIVINN